MTEDLEVSAFGCQLLEQAVGQGNLAESHLLDLRATLRDTQGEAFRAAYMDAATVSGILHAVGDVASAERIVQELKLAAQLRCPGTTPDQDTQFQAFAAGSNPGARRAPQVAVAKRPSAMALDRIPRKFR